MRCSKIRSGRLGLALTLALAGCTSTASKLRSRFANEHGCPREEVTVVESGGLEYRASGCGQSTEYVCGSFASMGKDERSCEERGVQKKVPSEPAQYPKPLDRLPSRK
jgi:hypothetical protein